MALSSDLISQFVKVTNDTEKKNSETTVSGTIVEYNGSKYVRLDGSDRMTPISATTDAELGERVTVLVKDHTATVTGNITSPSARIATVKENASKIEEIGSQISEFEIVIADKVSTTQLDAAVARITTLEAEDVTINGKLEAAEANITNLEADNVTIKKDLTAANANIDNLNANKLDVEVADAKYATITDLSATNANVHNLSADYADFKVAAADLVTAINADIENLEANKATIVDLNAAKAEIDTLDANYANINNLLAGNVSTGSSQTIVLNANNTTIANALIKDAMVDSLSFNKITGMDINTTKLTVHSDNGNSTWTDNTIQISDGTTVRVQIGEDDAGDYNLYLWDASGNMLWNATGVTSAGLNDGIIKDAAVASDANIAGSKLDIDSVMVAMNGSTTTISSSKVKIDSTGQTLEVAFNEAAYAMNNLYSTTETHSTQIKAAQGEIEALLVSSDDRLVDCNWLKTKYTDLSATVDGISSTVSSHTTTLNKQATQIETVESNITSLNTSVDGIEASVSSIQADYTGLEGRVTTNESSIKANADNIALKVSESDVTGNYLVSKINLDSTTATIAAKHINLVGSVTVSDFASATKSGLMTDAMIYYALSDSSTTAPTDGWNKTAPDWKSGKYMWQKTVTVYLDGSTEESVTCISGAKGDTGASGSSGVGVKSITNYYLASASSSGVTTSTSGWTTTIQTISTSKRYLWNYEIVTYTNGSTTETDPHVIGVYGNTGATGATGATGKGISLVNEYYAVSTSNTTAPTSWSLSVPTMTATNKYLWSYEMITYTDDTTSNTEKRVIGVYGDKGATGATGATGAAGADAIVVTVTASNGIVFKNNSGSTVLTAHVYKGNVEQSITDAGVCGSLGSIKWYKGSTAVATSKTLTVSASDVANSQAYTCQLEG